MRRALFAVLVAIISVLVFGCQETRTPIVLWHAYRGDEEKALKEVALSFAARHHVRVEILAVPWDAYSAKLGAAIPHAHGPDLFIEAHERLGSYRKDATEGDFVASTGSEVDAHVPLSTLSLEEGGSHARLTLGSNGERWFDGIDFEAASSAEITEKVLDNVQKSLAVSSR